jgi:hypothetical protein
MNALPSAWAMCPQAKADPRRTCRYEAAGFLKLALPRGQRQSNKINAL